VEAVCEFKGLTDVDPLLNDFSLHSLASFILLPVYPYHSRSDTTYNHDLFYDSGNIPALILDLVPRNRFGYRYFLITVVGFFVEYDFVGLELEH
jgi:hypothetical protein